MAKACSLVHRYTHSPSERLHQLLEVATRTSSLIPLHFLPGRHSKFQVNVERVASKHILAQCVAFRAQSLVPAPQLVTPELNGSGSTQPP